MIQVMIVEDEAPIQRSLKMLVESAHDKFEVVAMAYNGQEALELLRYMQPDMIITDIRMPLMNGLELTQEVRQQYPDIYIILLSGYQEFDYARRAMLLGVVHYLLKPTSKSKIKKLLDPLYVELMTKKKDAYLQYVNSLITGELQAVFPSVRQEPYGKHMLLLCCAGPLPIYSINDDIPGKVFWEQKDLHRILLEELEESGDFAVVNGNSVSEKWIMISLFKRQKIKRSPQEWVNMIAERIGEEFPVSIGYSQFSSNIQQAARFAKVIRITLFKNFIFGVPIRLSISDDRACPVVPNLSPDPVLERKLTLALEKQNIKLFKLEVNNLIEQWKQTQLSPVYIGDQLTRILENLHRTIGSLHSYTLEMLILDVHNAMMHATDYESMSRYIESLIDWLFSLREDDNEDLRDNERIMNKIEKYLLEHFPEPIDHQLLSERFGLVPSYLSKIFSKYKGISPSKYIVKLRVDAAKELLLEHPELMTKNVGEVVGYSDPSYFSRIFKRETGLYPSDFRKLNGVNKFGV